MNKNRISRPTRCDERAQHRKVAGSVAEVNAAVAPGSNVFLPGDTLTGQPERESAAAIVAMKSAKADGAKGQTDERHSTVARTLGPMTPERARF